METRITDINSDIENIRRECKIHRFASELQYTNDDKRKTHIKSILNVIQNKNNVDDEELKNKICDRIEVNSYKKSWLKLNNDQKINRINKFFESKEQNDVNDKLKKDLLELLKKSRLSSNISYDEKIGCILSVNLDIEKEKKPQKIKKT